MLNLIFDFLIISGAAYIQKEGRSDPISRAVLES